MNRSAFTLVELLVVVAIISLLMSILVPTLNVATDIAKQTVCANNMNSTGRGLHLYCELNKGRFPPYRSRWSSATSSPIADPHTKPEDTMWAGKAGDVNPVTLKPIYRGLGLLFKSGQLPSPKYYYCPAQTGSWLVERSYTYDETKGKEMLWGTYAAYTSMVRIGYNWNAWGKYYPSRTTWDFAALTLEQAENDKALVIDHGLFPWYMNVHMAKGLGKPTMNVAFPDSHVESITSELFPDVILNGAMDSGGGIVKNWEQAAPNNDWHDAYTVLMIQ